MANSAKDGEVLYTIRADDSKLESDLEASEKKVKKSAEQAADSSAQAARKSSETRKNTEEDVTRHHQEQNRQQEKNAEESYQKREGSAKNYGESLKNIAAGGAKAIGAGMLAAGAAVAGIGVAAVNSANDLDKAMNQFAASTGIGTEETERYKKVMEDIYTNNFGESFEDIASKMGAVKQQIQDLDDTDLQKVTEGVYTLSDVFESDFNETLRGVDQLMTQFGISADEALDLMAAGSQAGLNYTDELGDNIAEYGGKFEQAGYSAEEYFQLLKNGTEGGAYNLDKVNDAINEVTTKLADGTIEENLGLFSQSTQEVFQAWKDGGATQKDVIDAIVGDIRNCTNEQEALTMASTAFGTMGEDANLDFIKSLTSVGDEFSNVKGKMDEMKEVKYDDLGSVFEGLKRAVEVLIIPLGEQLIPLLKDLLEEALPAIEEYLPILIEKAGEFVQQLMPLIEEILPVLVETITSLGEPLLQLIDEILPVLLDVFSEIAPLLRDLAEEILQVLLEAFSEIAPLLGDLVKEILPILLETFSEIAPLLGNLIEEILPILVELFEKLVPTLVEIISELLPPLLEVVEALLPIFESVIDLLDPIIGLFLDLLDPVVDLIQEGLVPLLEALQPIVDYITAALIPVLEFLMQVFLEVFEGIITDVKSSIDRITDIFENIVEFVQNVFAGNWRAAWENIKDIFANIVGGFADILKRPINFCIDLLNGFIDGINSIVIPEWVPLVGGLSPNIPHIPRLKIGMDYVPEDFYPAYLDEGEAVLTKEENRLYRDLGGLQGMYQLSSGAADQTTVDIPEIDYERIGKETAKAMEGMGVYMDSKPVGKMVTSVVNEELGRIERRKT